KFASRRVPTPPPPLPSPPSPPLLQLADVCPLLLQACPTGTSCDCGSPRVWMPLWTLAWTPYRHSCPRDGLHNGNALEPRRTRCAVVPTVCRGPSTALDRAGQHAWTGPSRAGPARHGPRL
ncbi:I-Kappa-B like protein F2, partial [Frankliniella fusca]